MNKVTVLGSLNVDTILQIPRLPQPGETLAMTDQRSAGGGKGANQAISAARSGAATSFIGKIGDDENGRMMLSFLKDAGINTEQVTVSSKGTGQAFIMLQESGENSIIIYGGANQEIKDADIENAREMIQSSDFIVTQFETPFDQATHAFKIAKEAGVVTVLNPAPAHKNVDSELLQNVDLITPNETEAEILTEIKVVDQITAHEAATRLQELGAKNVIITLGGKGAYFKTATEEKLVKAFKVHAIDTTAAGDTFLGALVSRLNKDFSNLEESIIYASKASSIAVQKVGAIPSIPTEAQVKAALEAEK